MKFEKSCGIVVFTRIDDENKYVLVQSKRGHFGFPKGHVEEGETEIETAKREVFEEVRLSPTIISGFRKVSEYLIPNTDIKKQVIFFLGFYKSGEIIVQETELNNAVLVSYDDAMDLLKHENNKKLLMEANNYLHFLGEEINRWLY